MAKLPTKAWPYPRLIAHRGGGRFAPENTLAALRCGLEHGFNMVEIDVKLSKDNILILLHDDDVKRTSNGNGRAADKTYAELATLDMGQWHSAHYAGEQLPKFDDIAQFLLQNNLLCNIEIKPCPGREQITGQLVAQTAAQFFEHTNTLPLISSFSAEALRASQQAAPQLPRAFLCENYDDSTRQTLSQLDCVAVHPHEQVLNKELIQSIHSDGYKVCAWTVNDHQRAIDLLSWGCDAIFTDELVQNHTIMA